MTQEQEKAKELVEKYHLLCTELNPMAWEKARKSYAKQCAIICVNEIISDMDNEAMAHRVQYWNKVLTEIEKL